MISRELLYGMDDDCKGLLLCIVNPPPWPPSGEWEMKHDLSCIAAYKLDFLKQMIRDAKPRISSEGGLTTYRKLCNIFGI